MTEKTILNIARNKKRLLFDTIIKKDTTIIIDFYNVYCTMIKFCKFKTFSIETYKICMKRLIEAAQGRKLIIVSKNIFEVDTSEIVKIIKPYSNVKYILVVDDFKEKKGENKERDDYICLVCCQILGKDNSIIVSNDRYSNLDSLLKDIKPISLLMFPDHHKEQSFISSDIKIYNSMIIKNGFNRCGFRFVNKSKKNIF
jgi:hypothetical protein